MRGAVGGFRLTDGLVGRRSAAPFVDGFVVGAPPFAPVLRLGFPGGAKESSQKQGEHTDESRDPPKNAAFQSLVEKISDRQA